MKVNPVRDQKRHSLSVHAICSAARKWMHSSCGKPAVVPLNNRHTVAAMVPVPKVHRSVQPKGQQGITFGAGQLDPNTTGQFDHADRSDRMFHPEHFAHVQTLVSHPFTLDACCNPNGNNSLCERYCSTQDSFLNRSLQNEFVWLNPPFKNVKPFLDHYFSERQKTPDSTGACILLPAWRCFTEHPELAKLWKIVQYPKGSRLFSQPSVDGLSRVNMPGIPWAVNVYYHPLQQLKQAHVRGVSSDSPRLTFAGQVGHRPAKILFDTGATGTAYINLRCCRRLGLTPRPFKQVS